MNRSLNVQTSGTGLGIPYTSNRSPGGPINDRIPRGVGVPRPPRPVGVAGPAGLSGYAARDLGRVTIEGRAYLVGPALKRGIRSRAVEQLQADLRTLGYDPGPVDGIYGPQTAEGVEDFQTARELAVDGIVGPETRTELRTAMLTQTGTEILPPTHPDVGGTIGDAEAQIMSASFPGGMWGFIGVAAGLGLALFAAGSQTGE